jgi:hypothetical protein
VEAFGVLITFKMADLAMATKMQFFFNLFQASRNFTVMPHTTVDISTKYHEV